MRRYREFLMNSWMRTAAAALIGGTCFWRLLRLIRPICNSDSQQQTEEYAIADCRIVCLVKKTNECGPSATCRC